MAVGECVLGAERSQPVLHPSHSIQHHQTTDVQGGKVTFPSTGAELDTEPRTCVSLESALPGEERVVMDSSNQLETFPSH